MLLLDKRWSFAEVAEAFYIDNSTVRAWLKAFQDGGVEALVLFDLNGGASALSPLQIDELRAWATEALPTSTTEIGQFILERFGLDYTRSGLIKLMNRIGFDWKKPESVPGKIDVETQQKFIDAHEDLRNSLGPDEAVVYVDAVHPTNQSKPAGRWLPIRKDEINREFRLQRFQGLGRVRRLVNAESALAQELGHVHPNQRFILDKKDRLRRSVNLRAGVRHYFVPLAQAQTQLNSRGGKGFPAKRAKRGDRRDDVAVGVLFASRGALFPRYRNAMPETAHNTTTASGGARQATSSTKAAATITKSTGDKTALVQTGL